MAQLTKEDIEAAVLKLNSVKTITPPKRGFYGIEDGGGLFYVDGMIIHEDTIRQLIYSYINDSNQS